MFEDKQIVCRDCKEWFNFSAGEQEYFARRSLINKPNRCQNCRLEMRQRRGNNPSMIVYETDCAECGEKTKIPFKPKGHSPVFCMTCLVHRRQALATVS